MKTILIIMFIFMLITMILMVILNYISMKSFNDREKTSPFECGFNPQNSSRLPFSLQFFMVAVVFLIFDVEITLLIPLPIIMIYSNYTIITLMSSMFIIILLAGLYYEWYKGALNWMK